MPSSSLIPNTLFNSLGDNEVGDAGAIALADALRVTQNLKILRLVYGEVLHTVGGYFQVGALL